MAHYLVRARAKPEKLDELAARLAADAFVDLEPFGRALTRGLRGARAEGDGVIWEEEDYCSPPLAEERAAVLDAYFEDLAVEAVAKDEGNNHRNNTHRSPHATFVNANNGWRTKAIVRKRGYPSISRTFDSRKEAERWGRPGRR